MAHFYKFPFDYSQTALIGHLVYMFCYFLVIYKFICQPEIMLSALQTYLEMEKKCWWELSSANHYSEPTSENSQSCQGISNSCSASLSVCKLWCLLVSFVMHCSQKNTHTPRCFHTLWHELVLYDCLCRRQILALCDISGANICCVVLQPYSKSHNWHLKIPQMNLWVSLPFHEVRQAKSQ